MLMLLEQLESNTVEKKSEMKKIKNEKKIKIIKQEHFFYNSMFYLYVEI